MRDIIVLAGSCRAVQRGRGRPPRWIGLLWAAILAAILSFGSPRPAAAQSGISSPAPSSTLASDVPVIGTATIDPFQKYELHYKLEPSGDDAYIYFDGSTAPVVNGQLGVWRASGLAPGTYTLRLRVVKADGNYAEFFAPNLSVNTGPPPTPTSSEPTPTPIPTATFTPAPQPTPVVGEVEQPAALAELPTPTDTPQSVAAAGGETPAEEAPAQPAAALETLNASAEEGGSFTRELGEALALDRLRSRFLAGVRISAAVFLLVGAIYAGKRLYGWARTQMG